MASSSSCFSLVSLYSSYISRCLSVAGLSSQTIDIDDQTTIQFWGPKSPSNSNSNSDSNSALAKPALVLIHGFGPEALWQWRLQASFFARRNFAVYIPNLVFFGGSTTRSPDRSEVFQAISVGKLLERLGIERYSVAGTSYGGFVAYHMARMWPERVERVVIASSGVNMKRRDNEELVSRAKLQKVEDLMLPGTAAQLRTLVSLAIFRPPRLMPDFFLNDILRKLYSENRKEKMELLHGLTIGRDNTVELSPLRPDVLIVWGEQDQIFPLEKATELKQYVLRCWERRRSWK
ncbi:uncharacterized protein LOC127812612 isoform X2 [Diospyros lotus]|uniref:uncharacterized protein LOC127812612 isoform X2 n=1 Tax=Diospyros lotus TaxID=55363 RepID=UPI002251E6C0|nr:uncharacterized protein LOC127812612 isoform X2 [Diospyros lotus]